MNEYGGDYTNDSKEGDNKSKEESSSNSNQDCKGSKSISNVSKNDSKIDNKNFEPKANYKPDKKPFKPERDYKPDNKPFIPKANYKPDKEPFKPERDYKPDNINFIPKNKDFVEDIADKLEDYRSDKAFIDGINDDKEHLDNFKDFVEGFEDQNKIKDSDKENLIEIKEGIKNFDKKIKLDEKDLKNTWDKLRNDGYTLNQISEIIGIDIKGAVYRGYGINNESLEKLENLIGRGIARAEEIETLQNEDKINIESSILEEVCLELNNRGISNNQISKEIGTYIGNAIYKGYSIDQSSFKKLEDMYGKHIPHVIIENKTQAIELMEKLPNIKEPTYNQNHMTDVSIPENSIELEESEELAEFITISLGDGHIPENMYHVQITHNGKEEVEYIQYTKELMESLLKKKPKTRTHKGNNAIDLVITGKNTVGGLVTKGLIPGNKVKNQVGVPQWIKEKNEYQRSGLRGLTDTDGSIFVKKAQKSIRIQFQNHSKPLVEDFKEMCESLDIKAGNTTSHLRASIKREKLYRTYELLIAGKSGVSKFLDIIKPKKWEYRADTIGLTLISLKDSQKREAIENELYKIYPDKRVHYTEEYKYRLKNLCENQGYNTSKESIIEAIEEALTNKNTGKLSIHGKNVIDDLKYRLK